MQNSELTISSCLDTLNKPALGGFNTPYLTFPSTGGGGLPFWSKVSSMYNFSGIHSLASTLIFKEVFFQHPRKSSSRELLHFTLFNSQCLFSDIVRLTVQFINIRECELLAQSCESMSITAQIKYTINTFIENNFPI